MGDEERLGAIRAALESKVNELYTDLGFGIVVSKFSEGARVILVKPVPRGVYPVAHASISSLKGNLEGIVHGLWMKLQARGKDEVRSLREKLKASLK